MLKNYFKIAIRSLFKNKGYSLTNIIGLSIGFAMVILIAAYVRYETSYDNYFAQVDDIYRVNSALYSNDEVVRYSSKTPRKLAFEVADQISSVQYATNSYYEKCLVYFEEKRLVNQNVLWVSGDFFKVFGLELIEGDPATALIEPSKVVLTESKARALFGNLSPIGKTININEGLALEVKGVIADPPENTHLKYEYLFSVSTWLKYENLRNQNGWQNLLMYSYVRLHKESSATHTEQSINSYVQKNIGFMHESGRDLHLNLQPVQDIHLDTSYIDELEVGGDRKYIYIISAVGVAILVIVLINFINLATALSLKRTEEVGVRKAYGASRLQLIFQHLTEAFVVNVLAAILALVIVLICKQPITQFFEVSLNFELNEPIYWAVVLTIFTVCTLLSSAYPAFIVSSFKPQFALKGNISSLRGRGYSLKQVLVLIQFVAAIFLTVSAVVVLGQVKYMRSYDLGINMDQVLVINGPATLNATWQNIDSVHDRARKYDLFRTELKKHAFVEQVGSSRNVPGEESIQILNGLIRESSGESTDHKFSFRQVDEGFLDVFQAKILAGENFKLDLTEHRQEIIINETACEIFGFAKPSEAIGEIIKYRDVRWRIIGVVKDFHLRDLSVPIGPEIFLNVHPNQFGFYLVRLNTDDYQQGLSAIEDTWHKIYPEDPFHSFFSNAYFDQQYKKDIQFGKIFGFFTLLAIFIANLGLLAMVSLTTTENLKQIAIRRVLGASNKTVFLIMSQGFLLLIGIAACLAIPLSWYFLSNWLNDFAYRIELKSGVFIGGISLILIIAVINVFYYAVKVLKQNPAIIIREK
ncbi:ABC transporter permease [Seonamhaeicola marinus]|uniref:FtsX-like permease family protein n=1 Tax=Seonamhaeicola marinus TaxID=1912246 RepID=A0A5D0J9E2_9FLAO|nr:ABC transporter permease [Seonamhaeicola marinus]TYA92364.1 FtsX-like permease family protein [Seonamhaeicola marinus]